MVQDIYTLIFDLQSKGAPTLSKDMGTATKTTTGYDTATKNATKSSGQATTALGKQDKAVKNVQKSTGGATGAVKNFGGGMSTTLLGIGSLTQGIVGLQRSYRDLPDAQLQVDKANTKLRVSQKGLKTAQEQLTAAQKEHGKNSPEYAKALENVGIAEERVANATFSADEAQERFNDTQQNFYMNLLPVGIGLLTTLGGTLGPLKGALFGAAGGMTGMSKAGRILNTVLRFSPLFLLIGALIAIKTNAFGFRDALNKVGEKIGAMFPQLKGFLNWVKDLATALGLAEGGPDFGKAFDLLKTGFQNALTTIQTTDWGAVIDTIGESIKTGLTNFDWSAAWQGFKLAMFATGEWIAPRIQEIGAKILEAIQNHDWSATWKEFQDSMFALGTWIAPHIQAIGGLILTAIQEYDWVGAWASFRAAMWATGKWVGQQLLMIAGAILEAIQNYDWVTAWAAFRAAMWATGKWVGDTVLLIVKAVGAWWNANKGELTKAFFDFVEFVKDTAVRIGKSLPQWIIDGLKNMGDTLKRAGKFIWEKIVEGAKSIAGGLWESAVSLFKQSKAEGGLMVQSAAAGKVFTTRGPTLTMAGDNPGGRETVAYIPHNNPLPTLRNLMKAFGQNKAFNMGRGIGTMGTSSQIAVIHLHIHVGGKTTEEIIRQVEIGLGRNMRSI